MNTIAPSQLPSKIVCIGRNYAAHIAELGNQMAEQMVVFLKPNSAITEQLYSQHNNEPLHFETEICFKVKQGQIAEVAVGLDLTKRSLQTQLKNKGLPWERAKAFDGSALFSEFITIDISKVAQLSLTLFIEGKMQQRGGVELMLYKPDEILVQISDFMTLNDGDIIMTGTPEGVGAIKSGCEFIAQLHLAEQLILEQRWLAV